LVATSRSTPPRAELAALTPHPAQGLSATNASATALLRGTRLREEVIADVRQRFGLRHHILAAGGEDDDRNGRGGSKPSMPGNVMSLPNSGM
jgi:hypothetical protein